MSDFRKVKVIINVIGENNLVTDELESVGTTVVYLAVSELASIERIVDGIEISLLAVEDKL